MPPEPRHQQRLRAILSDPAVMAAIATAPSIQSAEASIARHAAYRATHGLGFWVVELDGDVAGFCGLKPGGADTPIAGEVEIGWIFDKPYWGRGLVSEAARAALAYAWANTEAPRVVAITSAAHRDSRRVMERLGMRHLHALDFDHPDFSKDDARSAHVVYVIERE